jgi:hypothetical protein
MREQNIFTQTGANSQQIQNQNNNFQNLKNVTTQNFQGANISNLTNIFNNNSGKKLSKNIVKKEIKVKENFVNRIDKNKLFRILIGASIVLPFVPIFLINGNDIEDIFNNYIYAYIFFFIAFSILMFPLYYAPNLFARTGIMKINDDNLFFKFGRKEVKIPFFNLRKKKMANGLLGKAVSQTNNDVTVYEVPVTAEFATVTIMVSNTSGSIATVNTYVTSAVNPTTDDLIGFQDELTALGGSVEFTCMVLSAGEKVVVNANNDECVIRVHGLEKAV